LFKPWRVSRICCHIVNSARYQNRNFNASWISLPLMRVLLITPN
jgi:hypothetical protein